MANFEIDEDQAALIRELRKLETSDPVHANVYNALFEKLINNDAFLERLANKMIEKSMLCHVLDSVNAQQVLAADVGPKITAITNELKENVSVLNTKITWKLLGTIKGRQAIDLPQQGTFSEIIAVVSYTYSVTRNYFIPIPAISLPATEQRANMGTGRGGDLGENVSVSLVISATSIRLATFVFDGAAYEANTTLTVYYK